MSDNSLHTNSLDDPIGHHPSSVGRQLQRAREAKGLSIADVAESLKLGKRQVEALEGDNWSQLPGNTFIRGFVRNYARLVNLVPTHLMDELDQKLDSLKPTLNLPESTHTEMPRSSGRAQERDYLLAIIGLGLVLLAALIYFLLPNDIGTLRSSFSSLLESISATKPSAVTPASNAATNSDPVVLPPGQTLNQVLTPQAIEPPSPDTIPSSTSPAPEAIPAKPAGESTVAAQPATTTTTTTASTVPLRLSFSQECWVEVRDRQGNVIFSQNGNAGMDRDIEGQRPFSLTIGNIKGVKVIHRGQLVDLAPYARGEVARLTLE